MKTLFLCCLLMTSFLCAQSDSGVVAVVGKYSISSDDLLTSYEFGPAFVRRRNDPLREHLKFMIAERLLALEAERNGLNNAEFVRERVKALEEDGAVEQLYRQEILSQVHLSDEQIAADVRNAAVTVSLRWIYCPTKETAERTSSFLSRGASFDSVYAAQLDPATGADSRSMETTLLKLERDNQDLAASIRTLRTGMISAPVQGKDGYYLFRLDRAEKNPIMTETDYANLRNQAVEIRTQLIADGLSERYVKSMMKFQTPVIKADGFNILRAYLADKGLSRDTKLQWEIPSTFMTEAGPQPIKNSGKYLNRTLVTFGGRSMTIRDYAVWYDIRQFQFDTRTLEAFNSSVKKTIWKMVQDKLLTEEALRRGLHRLPAVANETVKWDVKMLYLAQRAAVSRSIIVTDSILQLQYAQNKKRYADASGTAQPFSTVRESVKYDFLLQEEPRLLARTIDSLRKRYDVSVNEQLLGQLSRSIVSDPHAIETVFYKPGGTFPRVAFPTIDEAWGTMQ